MQMKPIIFLILSCLVIGCTSTPRDNSRYLESRIVGQWEWEEGPEECTNLISMAFKSNGTYTRTSESCDFADDGFGNFYYGWYVANNHICFVSIEQQFRGENKRPDLYKKLYRDERNKGFDKAKCTWKIQKIESSKITIIETDHKEQSKSFIMIKRRWL